MATSGDWLAYGCVVKQIIFTADLATSLTDSDSLVLMGWVYYLDVLTRFSGRHWRHHNVVAPDGTYAGNMLATPDSYCNAKVGSIELVYRCSCAGPDDEQRTPSWPFKTFRLLWDVCDTVLDPSNPRYNSTERRDRVAMLEEELDLASTLEPPAAEDAKMTKVTELYRLATLTYLERTSGSISSESPKVKAWTRKAFAILAELDSCQWQFPLLVFGCEARTDERRREFMDVMSRTEREVHARSLQELRATVSAVWVQDDLAEEDVGYVDKLTAVVSAVAFMPLFV